MNESVIIVRRTSLAALLALVAGCRLHSTATPEPRCTQAFSTIAVEPGQLAGRVRSLSTDCPIPDAVVRLDDAGETKTDTAGAFVFAVAPGRHRLQVRRVGFDVASAEVDMRADHGLAIDWRLRDACCISEDMHVPSSARPWWKLW